MGDCDKLKVIPNGIIPQLHRLEELHFPLSSENWEATIRNERSKVSPDELTSLTQLSTLDIWLPNLWLLPIDLLFGSLIRFNIKVGNLLGTYGGGDCSSQGVMKINAIRGSNDFNVWERLLGKPRWFNNLTQLLLEDCGLTYLFSPSCARELQQLQRLVISRSEIEAVIGTEGENHEEINAETTADVICFRQLKVLVLESLRPLISFHPGITESHSLAPAQSLFNKKVAFPALEEISISTLPNITEIWEKNLLPAETSPLLRSITVEHCKKLMNVAPLHVLQNTRTLKVSDCPELGVIAVLDGRVSDRREEEIEGNQVDPNNVLQLPHLRFLRLENLDGLLWFNNTSIITNTRPLFNNQVAFPALEELFICRVPNITEIWDSNSPPAESFCRLRSLEVKSCENLMNVAPSQMLPFLENIETLAVYGCSKIEVIAVLEKREEEAQEATNKDIIVFPKLWTMSLQKLRSLVGVCDYKPEDQNNRSQVRGREEIEEEQVDHIYGLQFPRLRILILKNLRSFSSFYNIFLTSEMQPLFNHQVALPALEQLSIDSVPNIIEIWDKNLRSTESFCSMGCLNVRGCAELMNVASSNMLPLLQNMRTFVVEDCPKMKVIIVLDSEREEEVDGDHFFKFPHIWFLKLKNLSLSHFNGTSIITTRMQPLFNHQVAFPALEELFIDSLPNITELWDKNMLPVESFCLLRSVKMKGCEKLINAVPSHMLPLLRIIEVLEVEDCPEMEAIVETQEASRKDLIRFLKLRRMRLQKLENLKGICVYISEDQPYFNVQVGFPELTDRDFDLHSDRIFTKANKMKGIAR